MYTPRLKAPFGHLCQPQRNPPEGHRGLIYRYQWLSSETTSLEKQLVVGVFQLEGRFCIIRALGLIVTIKQAGIISPRISLSLTLISGIDHGLYSMTDRVDDGLFGIDEMSMHCEPCRP